MKISDGFDARRLRPKGPSNWRLRLGVAFAALLALCGLLLSLAGGLLILWLGIWWWRRCRRRMHQPLSLNIASHLMKKHD